MIEHEHSRGEPQEIVDGEWKDISLQVQSDVQPRVKSRKESIYASWMQAFETVNDVIYRERNILTGPDIERDQRLYALGRQVRTAFSDTVWYVSLYTLYPIRNFVGMETAGYPAKPKPSDVERMTINFWTNYHILRIRTPRLAQDPVNRWMSRVARRVGNAFSAYQAVSPI